MCMPLLLTNLFPILVVVLALFSGGLFAVLLTGFGGFVDNLSVLSVAGGFLAAIIISWLGAVLLQTRWLAAILFSVPMAVGISFAAMSHQWWRCVILFACAVVPFVVIGLLQFDRRKWRSCSSSVISAYPKAS